MSDRMAHSPSPSGKKALRTSARVVREHFSDLAAAAPTSAQASSPVSVIAFSTTFQSVPNVQRPSVPEIKVAADVSVPHFSTNFSSRCAPPPPLPPMFNHSYPL